jgi:hypothetical protein
MQDNQWRGKSNLAQGCKEDVVQMRIVNLAANTHNSRDHGTLISAFPGRGTRAPQEIGKQIWHERKPR